MLRDEADAAPQRLRVEFAHVDAVDAHRAGRHVEQSRDEAEHRRLARTGRADERDALAGAGGERQVAHDRFVGARIAHLGVLEFDDAAHPTVGQDR